MVRIGVGDGVIYETYLQVGVELVGRHPHLDYEPVPEYGTEHVNIFCIINEADRVERNGFNVPELLYDTAEKVVQMYKDKYGPNLWLLKLTRSWGWLDIV